jgi:pimeloyl-ACP methyl ester carboxylesterase
MTSWDNSLGGWLQSTDSAATMVYPSRYREEDRGLTSNTLKFGLRAQDEVPSQHGFWRLNSDTIWLRETSMLPNTRYAKSGNVHVAYQVFGKGDIDLVFFPGFVSNIEVYWEEPHFARWLRRLANFARVITFDKRGTGLSDRLEVLPTMDERMDDVRAVMDAAGSERSAIFGMSEGGSLAALFAAHCPERCRSLVLWGAFAKFSFAFPTDESIQRFFEYVETGWGTGGNIGAWAPAMKDDPAFRAWFAKRERVSASPSAVMALMRMNMKIDISGILPFIRVPSLVVHRSDDPVSSVEGGRQLAASIPNAQLLELPGINHFPFLGEDADQVQDEVIEFLTGVRPVFGAERTLATVLLTDIVGSTERAEAMGDRRWRDLLDTHNAIFRRELTRFRGAEVKTTGDGFLATFDGPGRAILCSLALINSVKSLGIEIRAGLHTGEVEVVHNDVRGIAVHVAARVAALAKPSECLVTRTLKDLVAGADVNFSVRGKHRLKGLAEAVDLFAVVPGKS